MKRNAGERGASLVELAVVMGVIGLGLAFAGESFVAAASKHHGQAVTTEVAATLREARCLALLRRERVRVVFEPELMRVRTERADEPREQLRQYDYPNRGVVVERVSNGPSVMFYPTGRSASPTTVTLRNSRQERWQVTVSLTGRVSIQ
jgi:type IV fimbrial biogenesis protein FimT